MRSKGGSQLLSWQVSQASARPHRAWATLSVSHSIVFHAEHASLVSGPLRGPQCAPQDLSCQPDAFISL